MKKIIFAALLAIPFLASYSFAGKQINEETIDLENFVVDNQAQFCMVSMHRITDTGAFNSFEYSCDGSESERIKLTYDKYSIESVISGVGKSMKFAGKKLAHCMNPGANYTICQYSK